MAQKDIKLDYSGETDPLFKIALSNGIKTLLTLGFYRFWARTRERRYMWSAIRIGESGLEYTGKGLEKFLGFLIAVAFLAVYLGIIQLLLQFVGLATTTDGIPAITFLASFAVIPFLHYARYRARRYVLSRTRFRGIRFGAEKAAWSYTWEAIKLSLLTIVTLGIMLPKQVFQLEKFIVNRTYYGDAQLHQGGNWRELRKVATQYYIGLGLVLAGAAMLGIGGVIAFENESINPLVTLGFMALYGGYIWLVVGLMIFSVNAWRYHANNKRLGDNVTFTSEVDTTDVVVRQVVWGWLLAPIAGGLGGFIVGALLGAILAGLIGAILAASGANVVVGTSVGVGAVAGGYVTMFIGIFVLVLIWVTQPVVKMYATTLTVHNADALDKVKQREGDDFVEAEGFADALDVGAAI